MVIGKEISDTILKDLEVEAKMETKRVAFILFKDDVASRSFVSIKKKVAERLGVEAIVYEKFGLNTEEAVDFITSISRENFDGIVVQLPLTQDMDIEKVLNSIPKEADIDVLGEEAKRGFEKSESERVPPVAGAVWKILLKEHVTLVGKKIVVLGKGRLVGEPVSMLLKKHNIPFDIYDKNDDEDNVKGVIATADVIITGIGVSHFIKPEMIKEGVVLIDAGTSEQAGKLAGDVDPRCETRASLMTPVPGGVGPITVAVLFENLFKK